jgi:predicted nucleic-acid-binding Zn-ribbon protein
LRTSKTCPKCHSTVLWYVRNVAGNEDTGEAQEHPSFKLAVVGTSYHGTAGKLEAYACQGCGYTEMFLKERLHADGHYVIDVRTEAAPYRG